MKGFIRVWEERELADIGKHLIVLGELSAECFSCHKVGIDSKAKKCPNCNTDFKFLGFRKRATIYYLRKAREEFPDITLIDFDDFKKAIGQNAARKLLDM